MIERIDPIPVPEDATVQVTQCGERHVELRYCATTDGPPVQRLDKDTYAVVSPRTGEVLDVRTYSRSPTSSRASSPESLRKTFKRLRNIINSNVDAPERCKLVTLTYRDSVGVRDRARFLRDMKAFHAGLRRWLQQNGLPSYEYIEVMEPQASGRVHAHIIQVFPDTAPYVHFSVLKRFWPHGAVHVEALRTDATDNLGAYFCAYFTNLPVQEATRGTHGTLQVLSDGRDGKLPKAVVKGGRLHYYGSYQHIFRCSRGIRRPVVSRMQEQEARELVKGARLVYQKTIQVTDETGKEVFNVIDYRNYNYNKAPEEQTAPVEQPQ